MSRPVRPAVILVVLSVLISIYISAAMVPAKVYAQGIRRPGVPSGATPQNPAQLRSPHGLPASIARRNQSRPKLSPSLDKHFSATRKAFTLGAAGSNPIFPTE